MRIGQSMVLRTLAVVCCAVVLGAFGCGQDNPVGPTDPITPPDPTTNRNPTDDHGNMPATATFIGANSSTDGTLEQGPTTSTISRFVVAARTTLTAESTGNTDTFGRLEASDGSVLASNNDGAGSGVNFRIREEVSAGTYYIQVIGYLNDDVGPYTLVVSSAADAPSDDHGNMPATATSIGANSSTDGTLEQGGDVDYFRFVVSARTTLTVESTGNTDTFGQLEASDGSVLASNDDGGRGGVNFRIREEVSARYVLHPGPRLLSHCRPVYARGVERQDTAPAHHHLLLN